MFCICTGPNVDSWVALLSDLSNMPGHVRVDLLKSTINSDEDILVFTMFDSITFTWLFHYLQEDDSV
jgi:hypothetical protein